MRKLSIYLFSILLSFSNSIYADDIKEFEIEGISIGESLLEYLSKEQIISEIEVNKPTYNYLNEDFGEVYLFESSDKYYALSFMVKPKDKYFNIYSIRGMMYYDDKIEQCYTKQKEIVKEFSLQFKNTKKKEHDFIFPWDPTGKSHVFNIQFFFNSGDVITVSCAEYEKNLKIENNWQDGLSVTISKKRVNDWLSNHIN